MMYISFLLYLYHNRIHKHFLLLSCGWWCRSFRVTVPIPWLACITSPPYGMVFHPTSGSTLTYDQIYSSYRAQREPEKDVALPPPACLPRGILRHMLIREKELRLSPEYQKRYEEAERQETTSWLVVTELLQKQVITEFKLDDDMDVALFFLRCATEIYPDLRDIPLYVVHNRARDGYLMEGQEAPNVPVLTLDGGEGRLLDAQEAGRSIVVIGGSYS
eukprot:TRINITY_DN2086_c0_g1_i1.p1 TRINITY_DN2086_c0_g1~~TRINITY_DN2086_c0_g1_i1.p1  ORF type:complete len:218 (-),score=35.16 TRINITY_DN2086_c0_g1_i1:584-1237(-)